MVRVNPVHPLGDSGQQGQVGAVTYGLRNLLACEFEFEPSSKPIG